MKRTVVVVVATVISSVALATSGCGEILDESPTGPTEGGGSASSVEPELAFEVEPPLAVAVNTEASYTVSSDPGGRRFESFSVEPQSEAVEIVSKSLDSPEHPSFTLRASRTGLHPIRLKGAFADGREVERTTELEVREVAGIDLEPEGHEPGEEDRDAPVPYLVDSEAHLSYELLDSDGHLLAGSKPGLVEWQPKSALRLDEEESRGTRLVFETGSEPGVVTLRSSVGQNEQKIELVTPAMVDDIALAEYAEYGKPDWKLGIEGLWVAHIVPVYDGVTIFDSSIETSLSSKTPETCEAVADDRAKYERETGREVEMAFLGDRWPGHGSVVRFRGGDCHLHAEYPGANEGTGAELNVTIPVAD